jgi:6-pyruvoyltetrahydropterin/6-carboxytetrahydropterin synthase
MTRYLSTIELQKESMKFNAGHTTIFSATEREHLHGHLYAVYLALTTWVEDNGMVFDYRYYIDRVHQLCRTLNQTFLIPERSPFLQKTEDEQYYYFLFNHKKIPFLKEDVTLMPLANITIEELSRWFVQQLIENQAELHSHRIEKLVIKVFSAPGQSASHEWHRN